MTMTRLLFLASAGIVAVSLAVTAAPAAYAADRSDTVRYSRATLRDAPARLVLANVLPGDRIMRQVQCGGWVRVAVRPSAGRSLATTTGWVERGSLKKSARPGGLASRPTALRVVATWAGGARSSRQSTRRFTPTATTIEPGTGGTSTSRPGLPH